MSSRPTDIGTLIVRTPGFVGGRPRIVDHRIGVETIAELAQQGYEALDIVASIYPQLTLAEVHAALAYYYANRAEIDHYNAEHERVYREHLALTSSSNLPAD